MRRTLVTRSTAVVFAGALALGMPATANAQSAAPELGSVGGGCTTIDPGFGSMLESLDVSMVTKEGESGIADTVIDGGGWFSKTSGTLFWENTTTGASGEVPFGPQGGDANYFREDVATGAGEITWRVDAVAEGTPIWIGLPLATSVENLGLPPEIIPSFTVPYAGCTGSATIA